MVAFDKKDFQRFAVSTLGALALSATCVFAAVGPVRAAVPHPSAATGCHSAKPQLAKAVGTSIILVAAK